MFKRLHSAWNNLTFPAWAGLAALLLAAVLSYGLRLPSLGLYWDDLPYLWFYHALGPAGMNNSLGADRPLLAVLYNATLALVGEQPLAWQVFALVWRWACGVGFWFALAQAWPLKGSSRPSGALAAALLFTVFPGFIQHWISLVWGNAYVLYAFVFFSLGLTTWAVKAPRKRWYAFPLALGLSAFTLFSTEYFFGLELLRPALAWLALSQPGFKPRARLGRALLAWLPFALVMAVFAAWRFAHPFGGGGSEGLLTAVVNSPWVFLLRLPGRVLRDLATALLGAWGQAAAFGPLIESDGLLLVGLALAAGLLFWGFLARYRAAQESPQAQEDGRWALEAALLGLFAFLASGLPIWLTRLPYDLTFPWDRFSLVYGPGICLITAALLERLVRAPVRQAAALALLLGLSVAFQNSVADRFRTDWNLARDFLWQLSWRAPSIQPGTALIFDQIGLTYFEDDSLTGALNWMYDPHASTAQMNYIFFNIPERLIHLNYLTPHAAAVKDFRAMKFSGSTDAMIVVKYNPPGCVQVLSLQRDAQRADLPEFARRALSFSQPGLIQAGSPLAMPSILGSEPSRHWCYYYEQAALAQQLGQWDRIVSLEEQSLGHGYLPGDPNEYYPFIEAQLHKGLWDDARQLSRRAYDTSASVSPPLCALWKESESWNFATDAFRRARAGVQTDLHCTD